MVAAARPNELAIGSKEGPAARGESLSNGRGGRKQGQTYNSSERKTLRKDPSYPWNSFRSR